MNWYEIYLEDIKKKKNIENYINDKIKYKKPLIELVIKYATNHNAIETGSGTGVISTYIASKGYNVVSIDIDSQMLLLAKKIAENFDRTNKPIFKKDSIFSLEYQENEFDVSFSNGVLEHFSDAEIVDTLKRQMRIAKVVVFGIPTRYFDKKEAMYGNERYMKFSYWRYLIKIAGGVIIEEKSMHYMNFKNRMLNFKKYFRPYPYRIFVIRKEQ